LVSKVVVYTKEGCHLCEHVILELQKLQREQLFDLGTQDITADVELFERYKDVIPVVEIDGKIRLGGSALANWSALEGVLRKALSST
jgi:glutaredoxin